MDDFASRLAARLSRPLPGRAAQRQFEPELSFGRHYAPPPDDARSAAVIALFYPSADDWLLPLTARPHTMTDHAGQVSLPGGMIDPGESSEQAALRELEEELGVDRRSVTLLGQLTPLYLFVSNFQVVPWVGIVHEPPTLRPNPHEVAELIIAPVSQLLNEANVGRHGRRFNGLSFSAPHILWQGHHIWGATGMILGELRAVLGEALANPSTAISSQ